MIVDTSRTTVMIDVSITVIVIRNTNDSIVAMNINRESKQIV